MIKVLIKGNIDGIKVTGHANYDKYGKDIVCASVSSILITTVNAIIRIDKTSIKLDDKNGIVIDVLKKDDVVLKLLVNLCDLLEDLQKEYPKYIEIRRC